MMHIYNDIIERNDGESENNIIWGGMIMLRVDFTFDKKIIEKNGYTMSNIYENILFKFIKTIYITNIFNILSKSILASSVIYNFLNSTNDMIPPIISIQA